MSGRLGCIMEKLNSFLSHFKYVDVGISIVLSLLIFKYFWSSFWNNYAGLVLFFVGFSIWMKGLHDLGDSFGLLPVVKKLISKGIYSKIRHPIYLGGSLVDLGLSLYSLYWPIILLTLLLMAVQMFRIRKEENALIRKFREGYVKYKKQTWF